MKKSLVIIIIAIILLLLILLLVVLAFVKPTNPTKDCSESDCGPQLGIASYLCSDGKTYGGPTGRCLGQNGKCSWEIRSCTPYTNQNCSPVPTCPGVKETGEVDSNGCKYYTCPNTDPALCAPSDCGSQLGIASHLCPDNKTWAGPTGNCLRINGKCQWEIRSC